MISLIALPTIGGQIVWQQMDASFGNNEEGVTIYFHTSSFREPVRRREALKHMAKAFAENNVSWIKPGNKQWVIDLDALADFVPDLKTIKWFKGVVMMEPEFEPQGEDKHFDNLHKAHFAFYITLEAILASDFTMNTPPEIHGSLQKFRQEYPHPTKVAFIMMQFGQTKAHKAIVESIRSALKPHGIVALRADDKDYHDDTLPNILTYIYGCTFGIAVFERLEGDQFNPNVSLEVGYMLALQKPICLLKDATLKALTTDLVSKLYKPFDPQDPALSLPEPLLKWCADRKLIE